MNALRTSRRGILREALPASVAMLGRRRACEIPPGYIDDYVALDWLEWHGGGLRLTTVGQNILQDLARLARS
ncbi:MAG: hypothetical protein ABW005_00600 [Burkholderiaceae bacterium]